MANIRVKTDERRAQEASILRDFGNAPPTAEYREAAEIIAARAQEAYNELKRAESRRQ